MKIEVVNVELPFADYGFIAQRDFRSELIGTAAREGLGAEPHHVFGVERAADLETEARDTQVTLIFIRAEIAVMRVFLEVIVGVPVARGDGESWGTKPAEYLGVLALSAVSI